MNSRRVGLSEELIERVLRDRAQAPDPLLLEDILRGVDATAQVMPRFGRITAARRIPAPASPLLIVLLLLAALWAAAAIGAALIRPPTDPDLRVYENGAIIVSGGAIPTMRAIDPATGERVPADKLELAEGSGAAWAADGSRYAYVFERQIMVQDLGTGEPRAVGECTTDFRCDLSWSPDGEWLAVADRSFLGLLTVDTGGIREVANFPSGTLVLSPTWSPDGVTIAFSAGRRILTVSRDGSHLTEIASVPQSATVLIALAWSPDGSRIAYIGTEAGTAQEGYPLAIYLTEPDGTSHRKLRDVGECFCGGWPGPGIAWSPDGTQIAFTTVGYPGSGAAGALYVMDAAGGEPRLLSNNAAANPAWQPVPNLED